MTVNRITIQKADEAPIPTGSDILKAITESGYDIFSSDEKQIQSSPGQGIVIIGSRVHGGKTHSLIAAAVNLVKQTTQASPPHQNKLVFFAAEDSVVGLLGLFAKYINREEVFTGNYDVDSVGQYFSDNGFTLTIVHDANSLYTELQELPLGNVCHVLMDDVPANTIKNVMEIQSHVNGIFVATAPLSLEYVRSIPHSNLFGSEYRWIGKNAGAVYIVNIVNGVIESVGLRTSQPFTQVQQKVWALPTNPVR